MQQTFVVVGGGVGGGTAALALRSEGFEGRVVVVCDEPRAPYSKPPLSKGVLRGQDDAERTALRPPSWYDKRDIELLTGVGATDVDLAAHTVLLADGSKLTYDKLLLATGGRPRTLPGTSGKPGVFTLRTVEDSLAISARLTPGARVVVVGGGFIGAEVAASAVQLGCSVTVLEGQEAPLERVLPPMLGQLYMRLHRERGVDFRTQVAVTDLESGADGLVAHAASGERFPADVVVVGIGMVPNDDLALRAGLAVENGVVVDEHCRTSDPDVFAIGDVANAPNPLLGERMRVEHWQNAQHQAKVVAKNMVGGDVVFAEVPWVWSDQYEHTIQITGRPRPTDQVHLRGDIDGWRFSAVLTRDGVLCGCVSFNRADDVRAVRHLMTEHRQVSLESLTDPDVDLAALAADPTHPVRKATA
ncbi:MAG: 3-phenylpropionate/trans-cinnamate dioxygenase ferredoxin reductase component [Pseudonocardiales bacterium]|nr:3-phenylpropionate/trans-cinnamate dioxygenase ferredoxin reductase component [Pseudonocardiales bacterium]